jgi:NAD(P)-dependent dehydrogenase (short-subunit alcohol dehydrogenase family)
MKLENKVAIVTGSGRGIGRAVALAFAKEGAAVVVNDIDGEVAEAVVKEIAEAGGKAAACVTGVGSKAAADALVDTALGKFGSLHILVNNAGVTRDALLHKMTEEEWDQVVTIHLRGTFLNSQAAVRVMMENQYGKIVNVTSIAGTRGNVGQSNYSAAKMGIVGLTLTWAKELARHKINVNCISPAAVTRMTDAIPEKVRVQMFAQMAKESVLQRVGGPEDVAPLAVFLASEDSYYLTGQVVGATGGPMSLL